MRKNLIGGILLIVGTSVGGGMLALPMAVATLSYDHSLLLFISMWLLTLCGALYLLEVNLWLPAGANLISMARHTLGRPAEALTWLAYLLLLYTLLSAYSAGGADLINQGLHYAGITVPTVMARSGFALIMAAILFFGVRAVDGVNRLLMFAKLFIFILLVVVLVPQVQAKHLMGYSPQIKPVLLVVVTAFGYGSIVPTLRSYFDSDVRSLRLAIVIGSMMPLLGYLAWNLAVKGTIGSELLGQWQGHAQAVSHLTQSLSAIVDSAWFTTIAAVFTTLCISTSFLGVGLGLTDFIADGLQVNKTGRSAWLVLVIAVAPPLCVVLFYPAVFIPALAFAGLCCVYLLLFLPALMVTVGRYRQDRLRGHWQVWGGKPLAFLVLLLSAVLLVNAVWHLIN